MRVRIDRSASEFAFTGQTDEYGDRRRYYLSSARRMIVVCRNGLELGALVGATVDVALGWDPGTPGFVHERNVEQQHSKLTIFRQSRHGRYDKTLRQILSDAPGQRR